MSRGLVIVVLLAAALRLASLPVVSQPGYTDAYYYSVVAGRLADGQGLTADFVWSFVEAPGLQPLPVASHRFWMPLVSVIEAGGIVVLGSWLDDFRAGQAALLLFAGALPALTYLLARRIGGDRHVALAAAAIIGAGGLFAPAWVSADAFAVAGVLGSAYFLLLPQIRRNSVPAGLAAGAVVGLLFLARAEAALFGVPLLLLALRAETRRAGAAASAVALAIGTAWLLRGLAAGGPGDVIARTLLLGRYDAFFALAPQGVTGDAAALVGARLDALATNALTACAALLFVLVPGLVREGRRSWSSGDIRTFVGLGVGIYLFQSLVVPLHAVRGSYFHSLAALFPFAVAIAAVGWASWLGSRRAHVALAAAPLAFAAVGVVALSQWAAAFDPPYRARVAALPAIPDGPFLALDAAAWRWISGRSVIVTPSEGLEAARCAAAAYGALALVLEPAHFTTYDGLAPAEGVAVIPIEGRCAAP